MWIMVAYLQVVFFGGNADSKLTLRKHDILLMKPQCK